MTFEFLLIIMKWVWGGFTALMGGMLLHLWKEYRANKNQYAERLISIERDILKLQTTSVTQDRLDEVIDRKLNPLKDQMFRLENQLQSIREQQQQDFKELLKAIRDKQ